MRSEEAQFLYISNDDVVKNQFTRTCTFHEILCFTAKFYSYFESCSNIVSCSWTLCMLCRNLDTVSCLY